MVNEISTRARATNRYAKGICLALFLTALFIFIVSGSLSSYRGLVSLFGLIILSVGIMI